MRRKVVSVFLTVCMVLSMLPSTAFAVEAEEVYTQSLTLPVVAQGEEMPKAQGYGGGISLFSLIPNRTDYAYAYEGVSRAYPRLSNGNFTFLVAAGVEPASGGVLQVVDGEGKVLAGSRDCYYYKDNYYEDESGETERWYAYSISFDDDYAAAEYKFADIPAGEYTLQLAVGEERYTVDQQLCVVDRESLLIRSARADLYYDNQEAEVSLAIHGLNSEADLAKMSLTLTDEGGDVIARSTGAYREFGYNSSDDYWTFYMELAVEEGKSLLYSGSYSLTISDTSNRALVDGVGGVEAWTSEHQTELGGGWFSDAQNGVFTVELNYPRAGMTYDVMVSEDWDGATVYGSWNGVVPENGQIIIPLTMNGLQASADSYPGNLHVRWKISSYSNWNQTNVDNPYRYSSNWNAQFEPSAVSSTTKTLPFTLELHNFSAYRGDGTDVLTVCNAEGTQVASCSSFTEDWQGSQIYLTGTLKFTESLTQTRYTLFLNGVEIDTLRVTNEPSFSWRIAYSDWNGGVGTLWTNFGVLPVSADVFNSSGSARIELRDEDGNVLLTTGPMTQSAGEHTGYLHYEGVFKQEDLAQYADTPMYLTFVDGTYTSNRSDAYYYDSTQSAIVFYNSNGGSYTVDVSWWNLAAGDTTLELGTYQLRNVSEAELLDRLGDLRLVCGDTTVTVTGLRWDDPEDLYYGLSAVLSAPITAGEWNAYDGNTELCEVTVSGTSAEQEEIWVGNVETEGWYISCRNLPTNSKYTAKIYQNYTCLTEQAFALTLYNREESDGSQYLRLPKAVVSELERGEYELRLYRDGTLLDSTEFTVEGDLQPTITMGDEFGNRGRIIRGDYVHFEVNGSWGYFRAAESEAELANARWYDLDYVYDLSDTETVGERTIYVQLSQDANGTKTSDVVSLSFLYLGRMYNDKMDVHVREDVEGFYGGDSVTLSLGADYPYAYGVVELVDGGGSVSAVRLNYQGKGKLPALSASGSGDELIASPHPYTAGMNQTWEYTLPGAERIEVTFSAETQVESNWDYLFVYYVENGVDVLYNDTRYTGTSLAGQTLTLPGDTVKVRLTSDGSGQYYGFDVVSVVDPDAEPEEGEEAEPTYHIYSATLDTADYLGTEKLCFYLVEDADDTNGGRWSLISDVEERSLIFGDPTAVILPQFSDEDKNYVLTNQTSYSLYGYGIPGSTVTLSYRVGDGSETLGTATAAANGKFTMELTDLAEGLYSFTVTSQTDDNVIYGYGELEVDTTAPQIEGMGFAFSDSDTATLSWTCNDEDLYRSAVYLVTDSGEQRLGYVYSSAGANGVFSMTVTASSNDGQRFKVVVEDEAGNKASRTVSTSDQEPPTAPGALTYTGRTASSITLSWTAGSDNVGMAGYNIYFKSEKSSENDTETGAVSGTCGDNVTWSVEDGLLSFTGTGKMTDYDSHLSTPWCQYENEITSISIGNGITHIGARTMCFNNATFVVIPASVTSVGEVAFGFGSIREIKFLGNAPTLDEFAFDSVGELKVLYPASDSSWDNVERRNYCLGDAEGEPRVTVTWEAYSAEGSTNNGGLDGEKIGQTTGEALTYTVTGLEQGTEYTFWVASRDLAGNLSENNLQLTVTTAKLSVDASIPGTITTNGANSVAVTVQGALAADVTDYVPGVEQFYIRYQAQGDNAAPVQDGWIEQTLSGVSLSGSTAKGIWNVSVPADAQLPLTYWVQVVAADGEDVVAYSDVKTLTLADGRVNFTVKDSKTGDVISGADVSVYQDGVLKLSGTADAQGKILLGLEDGSYSLMARADGYQMRSISSVTISEDRLEFTIYMNTEDILQVETTVKEMTYDEIVAAGIDPAAAGNQHVYECTVILDFVPIKYICAGDQVLQSEPVQVGDYIVYPAARDIFLIIPTQTTWLKEMFDVQLLVTNSSTFEDVENCVANLTLPNGLSLAEMSDGIQSMTANLGTITPGGSASHHWYVRGDAEGDYTISGNVTGTRVGGGLSEDVAVGFTTQDPISVLAGSAMKLTIEAERRATIGEPYNMRFTLQNVSNKSLYNVNFDVLGGTFRQAYDIEAVLASYDLEGPFKPDADNSELLNGFVLSAEEFKPADVLSGVFTITFGEGIDDPDAVRYMLKKVFLFTGAGSTTEIPTEVIFVDEVSNHVHTFDEGVVTKQPTCTEDGVKTFTCIDSNCGETITVDIPAIGHSMGQWVTTKDATCTEGGSAESECTNEGCDYKDTMTLSALGHSYADEWTTDLEPTCTAEGSKSRHCTRQGCDAKTDVTVIPANGHSYGPWEKHNDTQHKHTCTVELCKFVEYADHAWNGGEETTAPTHLTEGVKTFTCTEATCGQTKTEAIAKLPDHIWGDWQSISDTQHKRECPCGEDETADHAWNDGVETTAPTHLAEGVKTFTCTEATCGQTKTEAIDKLPDHIWGDWKKDSDTQHKRECPCGESETADHGWSSWTTTTAPTCTLGGEERRDCDSCEAYETKSIPANGHSWNSGAVTKEPTLDEEGVRTFTCTVCTETRTESIAKLQKQDMYFSTNLLNQDMVKTYGDPNFTDMLFNESVEEPVLTYTSSDEKVAVVDENGWVTIKGAGTAIISATSAAIPYQYVETTASYKLVVNKAALTITVNDAAITYGETFAPNGYAANGFVYGEATDVLSGEVAYSCEYVQYGTVGEYPITVSGLASDNYEITVVPGKLTVSKATDYTITFGNHAQKEGDVTPVTAVTVPQDTSAVIKLEYKVDGQWTTTVPTAAGTYPVRAELTGSDNIALDGHIYGDQLVIEAVDSIGGISVSVKTEDDSENATVEVSDDEVKQIVESLEGTNGDLAMNLESIDKDTLTLPGNLIEELGKSEDLKTVTVTTGNSSISMSDTVLNTMADAMDKEDTVSLQMNTVDVNELDEAQKNALESIGGPSPMTVVLELKLTVTDEQGEVKKEIKDLGDMVDITIQCSQEMANKRVVACYISPDGTVTYLVAKYDEASNSLSFKTNHFSTYAAVALNENERMVYVVDENGVELSVTGAGPQTVGASVTIQAPAAPSGYRFSGWQVVSGTVTLTNANSASTTFTMPEEDVTLKPTYSRRPAVVTGGSGSSKPTTYTLTVDEMENGSVALSGKEASAGDSVTITVKADEGYQLNVLTILDKNGKEVEVTKKTDTEYTFNMPAGKVVVKATFAEIVVERENPFVDVAEEEYYYDAVLWAVENGITGGTSATTFSPAAVCTRAQMIMFLWRVAGSPETATTCPFTDVTPSDYYYNAVLWAVENGITSGTSATTFSPDDTVTRAQSVTFLWRVAKSPAAAKSNHFVDVSGDDYYHNAVRWAAETGITAGTSESTFSPENPCLRGQIITFLYRYVKG